ncbi:MAG: class II aldolase/adducin family protein [Chloroflexi bacterium]|nr:class II aldolase/adducin family protein [Chloroflexota bacterium]OJV91888.1 MAG: rhamnulose-1-phosphate aldolase [Chloroflexi bacterium 54-19]
MSLTEPFPDLDEFLVAIGIAGQRLASIEASEGAAGNISILIGWPIEVRRRFPIAEPIELPLPAPALAGQTIIVSGSGRRLRDIHTDPAANLAAIVIGTDGITGTLHTSPRRLFERVTSEFNSHLAVHNDQVTLFGTNFQALIHAQPPNLVYLSHVPAYQDQTFMNKRIIRWEPETIVQLPEGLGVLPFLLPGSPAMMEGNVKLLREHQVVLWGKHGVMARSDKSVTRAADRIEYLETAAHYEYMDLVCGGKAEGLSVEQLQEVVRAFNVNTKLI